MGHRLDCGFVSSMKQKLAFFGESTRPKSFFSLFSSFLAVFKFLAEKKIIFVFRELHKEQHHGND